MSQINVPVPDIGDFKDVEVVAVLVAPGDLLEPDQPLIELETDKASMEVPSPQAGRVLSVSVSTGDRINEGDLILVLETEAGADAEKEPAAPAEAASEQPQEKPLDQPSAASEIIEVSVPDIGGFDSVPVVEVCVEVGAVVEQEVPLFTLETDKASMDVPAPVAGTIEALLLEVGSKVSEGTPMARIRVAAKAQSASEKSADAGPERSSAGTAEQHASNTPQLAEEGSTAAPYGAPVKQTRVHAGPAVRKLAREFGVDLAAVTPTGPRGRIVKEDVQQHVKAGMQQLQAGSGGSPLAGPGLPRTRLPDFSQFGPVERVAMDKIHRLTAENMVRSWLTVPHVTQFDKADITDMEAFRKSLAPEADKKGLKLTPLPFLVKACARVLQALPQFNVALDMERFEVVRKGYIHIGLAVDTPKGLVVPVVQHADRKGLWELAAEISDLAARARDGKLGPKAMQGGCFTISSLGSVGGTAFTPIVNAPEVAILGVSRAEHQPVWNGSQFEPRLMLPLSLSYDHRAVNGAEAARFTSLLSRQLGDLRQMLL